jgi:hypothetical protein
LGDLKNRLNSHRHINATKMKQLEELQTRYDLMVKEAEEAVQTDAGESETAAVCINIFLLNICRTPFDLILWLQAGISETEKSPKGFGPTGEELWPTD